MVINMIALFIPPEITRGVNSDDFCDPVLLPFSRTSIRTSQVLLNTPPYIIKTFVLQYILVRIHSESFALSLIE